MVSRQRKELPPETQEFFQRLGRIFGSVMESQLTKRLTSSNDCLVIAIALKSDGLYNTLEVLKCAEYPREDSCTKSRRSCISSGFTHMTTENRSLHMNVAAPSVTTINQSSHISSNTTKSVYEQKHI